MPTPTTRSRFRGCLLGGAVGDALGAPVEFLSFADIQRRFGPDGIGDFHPAYGRLGAVTDDTQMTLFTAEGLLRAYVRGCLKGITTIPGVTASAYLRWLTTQAERNEHLRSHVEEGEADGWLISHPELHHRRGPGNTCLTALRSMRRLGDRADNDSKGCGTVMRTAPVALAFWRPGGGWDPAHVFRIGVELAALTHGHPTGQLTAGAMSVVLASLLDGEDLVSAVGSARGQTLSWPEHSETVAALDHALALAQADVPPREAIEQLGEGWIAEEALAIGLYCALVAEDFRHGVTLAVNHDGDTDSTGSIAGNFLGAMLGIDAIPSAWCAQVELGDVILEVADDLLQHADWQLSDYGGEDNERIWRKYPGH